MSTHHEPATREQWIGTAPKGVEQRPREFDLAGGAFHPELGSPRMKPTVALQLQHTLGNQVVRRLLAQTSLATSGHATALIQRKGPYRANWVGNVLNGFLVALDALVKRCANEILDDPVTLPVQTGHIENWKRAYAALQANEGTPPFIFARFGYAVETLVGYHIGQGALGPALPGGHKIHLQVAQGPTIPDIVVLDTADKQIGWFDITAEDSEGHIANKVGSGWSTRNYVAEVFYDRLDPSQLGRKNKTPAQAAKINVAVKAERKDWEARLKAMGELIEAWAGSLTSQIMQGALGNNNQDKQTFLRARLAGKFGGDVGSNVARSLLEMTYQAETANYHFTTFGYGSQKEGRDRHTAEELLLQL